MKIVNSGTTQSNFKSGTLSNYNPSWSSTIFPNSAEYVLINIFWLLERIMLSSAMTIFTSIKCSANRSNFLNLLLNVYCCFQIVNSSKTTGNLQSGTITFSDSSGFSTTITNRTKYVWISNYYLRDYCSGVLLLLSINCLLRSLHDFVSFLNHYCANIDGWYFCVVTKTKHDMNSNKIFHWLFYKVRIFILSVINYVLLTLTNIISPMIFPYQYNTMYI